MARVTEHRYIQQGIEWILYDADDECEHEYDEEQWSGVTCVKCKGWFCF